MSLRSAPSPLDRLLSSVDQGLRTVFGAPHASRLAPAPEATATLDADQRDLAGALMRVNHVGEVCAQALYQSQAMVCRDPALRAHFEQAAQDERDHLAWTHQRVRE